MPRYIIFLLYESSISIPAIMLFEIKYYGGFLQRNRIYLSREIIIIILCAHNILSHIILAACLLLLLMRV